jgi:vancomycin resistance protein YoaR
VKGVPRFAALDNVRRAVSRPVALASVGLCALAGTAIGVLLVPRAPEPEPADTPAPQVRFLGSDLALGEGSVERAVERVRRFAARSFTLKLPEGAFRTYSLGTLGAQVDTARLTQLVRDAQDSTSPLRRVWKTAGLDVETAGTVAGQPPKTLPVPVSLDLHEALPTLLRLKDALDRAPVDARLDLEKRQVQPEVVGLELDVDATLEAIDDALGRGELSAEARFVELLPKRRASQLGAVDFSRVLGSFETNYNRGEQAQDRTYNLRLAASKLDGTVLLPGEVFDFNEVVGPRDEANGYKVAHVIADGELVDGIGGGTCQISGTLHGAAFFGGLAIVERYPHTRPSAYIKMGLDATVVYPTINFRIKNPFDFPVVLHQTVKNGVVRAEILGPPHELTVSLIRHIDAAIPFDEVERSDPDLPHGERVLAQRGIPGFRLHRYRIVRDGDHAVRERWNDVYPPAAQIVRVGTGKKGDAKSDKLGAKKKDDPTPEYLADELLVMTLRTDDDGKRDFSENREKGKFGEEGWTKKSGMPSWEAEASNN